MTSSADELIVDEHATRIIKGPNGEYNLDATLAELAISKGLDIRGCGSCAEFRFSGMTFQMSGGAAGYCGLVGFRTPRAQVNIGDGCGEHSFVEGWPHDLALVSTSRTTRRPGGRENAFVGAVLGLAVGDALGFPAEFRRRDQIMTAFPPSGINDFVALHDPRWPRLPMIFGPRHPAGTYSDDTQMTLAVAEGLLAGGKNASVDDIMHHIAHAFVRWSSADDNDRAPGNACMTGCAELANGTDWRVAGVEDSKGCGSAMRVAPIGLVYASDTERLLEVARAQSLLTHRHDAGIEGAAAAALLVSLALAKRSPSEMYEAVMQECAPRSPDLHACFAKLPGLLHAPPEIALSTRGLGEGWVAEEAVASALYCFWRSPDDFENTVLMGANTDGDSDSIACIAGAISGAFNGAKAIPERWRASVENAGHLEEIGRRLLQLEREIR
jgi:ADP-ribosylglycohydrolase